MAHCVVCLSRREGIFKRRCVAGEQLAIDVKQNQTICDIVGKMSNAKGTARNCLMLLCLIARPPRQFTTRYCLFIPIIAL